METRIPKKDNTPIEYFDLATTVPVEAHVYECIKKKGDIIQDLTMQFSNTDDQQ